MKKIFFDVRLLIFNVSNQLHWIIRRFIYVYCKNGLHFEQKNKDAIVCKTAVGSYMLLKQEDFANDEEFEECVSTSCVSSSIYGEPVCQFMNRKRAEGKPYRV